MGQFGYRMKAEKEDEMSDVYWDYTLLNKGTVVDKKRVYKHVDHIGDRRYELPTGEHPPKYIIAKGEVYVLTEYFQRGSSAKYELISGMATTWEKMGKPVPRKVIISFVGDFDFKQKNLAIRPSGKDNWVATVTLNGVEYSGTGDSAVNAVDVLEGKRIT